MSILCLDNLHFVIFHLTSRFLNDQIFDDFLGASLAKVWRPTKHLQESPFV
jgi:TM2 domain-containing membrane protein YozV